MAVSLKQLFTIPGLIQAPGSSKGVQMMAIGVLLLDNSYPEEGYPITAGTFGLRTLDNAFPISMQNVRLEAGGEEIVPLPAISTETGNLTLYGTAANAVGLTEIAAGSDLSNAQVVFLVLGTP